MKKITLIIGLSLVSLAGWAQQENKSTTISESLERQEEYIIVLDNVNVENNIDDLLSGDQLSREMNSDLGAHELAHEESYDRSLEGKFVDGTYSYNAYAVNYNAQQSMNSTFGS
jgi:hypothetical protein